MLWIYFFGAVLTLSGCFGQSWTDVHSAYVGVVDSPQFGKNYSAQERQIFKGCLASNVSYVFEMPMKHCSASRWSEIRTDEVELTAAQQSGEKCAVAVEVFKDRNRQVVFACAEKAGH